MIRRYKKFKVYHSCATKVETGGKDAYSPLKDKWKSSCGTVWRKTCSLESTKKSFQTYIVCTEHVVLLMTRFCVHVLHINKLINQLKRHTMKIIIYRILSKVLIRHRWRRGVSFIQVAGQLTLICRWRKQMPDSRLHPTANKQWESRYTACTGAWLLTISLPLLPEVTNFQYKRLF